MPSGRGDAKDKNKKKSEEQLERELKKELGATGPAHDLRDREAETERKRELGEGSQPMIATLTGRKRRGTRGTTASTAEREEPAASASLSELKRSSGDTDAAKPESEEESQPVLAEGAALGPEPSATLSAQGEGGGRPSQSTQLVALADDAELFHSPDGAGYATVEVNGHAETWPLKSRGFRRWLQHRFFEAKEKAPSQQAVQNALGVLDARALWRGPEREVSVRVAEGDGTTYLDLANSEWEAVRIDPTGWQVVRNPPVKFRRAGGLLALPRPVAGGDIADLRTFVNVTNDTDWTLLVGWLIAAFRPRGPFPVLVLHGEQGSAKSTTARVLRSLVDPSTAPLRSEPRDVRDIMIAANNSWCTVFDNLSRLPVWLSDVLCRLATGGGFATRELYTDAEEVLFDAQRPVIINGIEELATRGDLLDRAVILNLPSISEEKRRPEREFGQAFKERAPHILGALLDAVACAMRTLEATKLPVLPRMADFALFVTAAEPSLGWASRSFLAAYMGNRDVANEVALEASPVAVALFGLLETDGQFLGTATELFGRLGQSLDEEIKHRGGWPRSPQQLSNALLRIEPNLRVLGIQIERRRDPTKTRARLISITRDVQHGSVRNLQGVRDRSQPGALADDAAELEDAAPDDRTIGSAKPGMRPDRTDGLDDQMVRAAEDSGLVDGDT